MEKLSSSPLLQGAEANLALVPVYLVCSGLLVAASGEGTCFSMALNCRKFVTACSAGLGGVSFVLGVVLLLLRRAFHRAALGLAQQTDPAPRYVGQLRKGRSG